jgi:hypothetical protein
MLDSTIPIKLNESPLQTYMIPVFDKKEEEEKDEEKVEKKKDEFSWLFDIRKYLENYKNILDHIAFYIDDKENAISLFLAKTMSRNKNNEEDVLLIKSNLIMFLNVLLSCLVVYNWYFAFSNDGIGINIPKLKLEKLKDQFGLVHFIFKYILCFLSINTYIIFDRYSKLIKFKDSRIQFLLLLISIILILVYFGSNILNSGNSVGYKTFFTYLFVAYGCFCMSKDFEINLRDPLSTTINLYSSYRKYYGFGIFSPLILLIMFTCRVFGSVQFVQLAILLNFIYFALISLLIIPIFSTHNPYTTFKNMNNSIRNDKENQTTGFLGLFISIIYSFIFEIIFICVFVSGIVDYSLKMNDTRDLQYALISLCSIVILILIYIIYKRFQTMTFVIPGFKSFDFGNVSKAAGNVSKTARNVSGVVGNARALMNLRKLGKKGIVDKLKALGNKSNIQNTLINSSKMLGSDGIGNTLLQNGTKVLDKHLPIPITTMNMDTIKENVQNNLIKKGTEILDNHLPIPITAMNLDTIKENVQNAVIEKSKGLLDNSVKTLPK